MTRKVELSKSIADKDFDIILDACWGQITLFAFEQYKTRGRGAVLLDRHGWPPISFKARWIQRMLSMSLGRPRPDASRLIQEYDPSWEIVFQYLRTDADGNVRTARIRTAPGNRHPWGIYLFERLMQDEAGEEE